MIFTFVNNLFAFIIVLGFLIFVHEAGHFLVAKLFGVRVLVFSFGFGKRLFGFKRGDTDYRVSLIPLGGYVRMAGDTPEESTPADPAEFLAKPKWQRFTILLAGPFMNVVIAIVFLAIVYVAGTEMQAIPPVLSEVSAGQPAARAGLAAGDRITRIDGEPVTTFDDIRAAVAAGAGSSLKFVYTRNGRTYETTVVPETARSEFGYIGRIGVKPLWPAVVGRVTKGSPADRAGIRAGDLIVSVNGKHIRDYFDLDDALGRPHGPAAVEFSRGAVVRSAVLPASKASDQGIEGIIPPTIEKRLSVPSAIAESVHENIRMVGYIASALRNVFTGGASVRQFTGPVSIAKISGAVLRTGWKAVIEFMSLVSINLGVMNLLPIPVLDGGHIAVLLIEGAVRRDLSLQTKERVQTVGFALIVLLMLVVMYNDVLFNFAGR